MKDLDFTDNVLASYGCNYNGSNFLDKIKKIALRAGSELIYKALLLYYVLVEDKVPIQVKTLITGALGYLILPIDLVPDYIIGLGFTDDLAAISFVLAQIEEYRTPSVERKAKELFKDIFDTPYGNM